MVAVAMHRVQVRLPGVEAVYVMGAFNNWSTTCTPMCHQGDGWWEATLPVTCGGRMRLFVWDAGRRCGRFAPLDLHASASPSPNSDTPAPVSAYKEPMTYEAAGESSVVPVPRP